MGKRRSYGSIRRLPSGRYQVRYRDLAGCIRTAERTFPTKTDAAHWLTAVEVDQHRGWWLDPDAGMISLGEYARRWLDGRVNLSPRTSEIYEAQLRLHILPAVRNDVPALGEIALADLGPEVARAWYAALRATKGPSIAAKAYTRLRQILGQAVDDDRIAKNPCRIEGGGVERHPEQRFVSLQELYAIAGVIEPRYRALILTAGYAGLRQGELFALRRGDLDLERATVAVRRKRLRLASGAVIEDDPKSEAGRRTVALPAPLVLELKHHLALYGGRGRDAYVFTSSAGTPIERNNFRNRVWLPALSCVGLDGLRFHDLRHTAGTLAAQTGATTKELMARLGHASSRAAMMYQHASDERDRLIADRLAAMAEEAGVLTVVPLRSADKFPVRSGTDVARNETGEPQGLAGKRLTSAFAVVGAGVDPATSRFSGARSTN